jgi:hypothetical protein
MSMMLTFGKQAFKARRTIRTYVRFTGLSYTEFLLSVKLSDVVREIAEIVRRVELEGGSEEDLKVNVEMVLNQKVWNALGVPRPRYEYELKGVEGILVKHYRVDALYGLTIFEYKKPGTLRRTGAREEAVRKMKDEYIPALLADSNIRRIVDGIRIRGLVPRMAGIVLDGYNVIFVDCNLDANTCDVEPKVGIYTLDVERLRSIVRVVVASYKKKLDARTLASDFGFRSNIAQKAVRAFYNALVNPRSEKTVIFFEEWRKLASYAYPLSGEELRKIAEYYGFTEREAREVDGVKLFYAIQSYYALVLKLLAAEVAARFYDTVASEYIKRLLKLKDEEALKRELRLLEQGAVYKWFGIRNFLEGEMFSWYLDEWNEEIYRVVKEIIEMLDEYDVVILAQDLPSARDLFKLLYEELVPREEVRKYLGIYTTPDWLAELILDELGLTVEGFARLESQGIDPVNIKVLDPGVGTGTFLSLVIQRIASYLKQKYPSGIPANVAQHALTAITGNIVGFDIDALAILTAKTNYLLALAAAELLAYKGGVEIEIPIYMANSIVTAEELKELAMVPLEGKTLTLEIIKIPTVIKDLLLPLKLVRSDKFNEFLLRISHLLEQRKPSSSSEVLETLKIYAVGDSDEERNAAVKIAMEFYDELFKHISERDVNLVPIIKSYTTSTMFEGRFDYVVGNPPWIAYRYIMSPVYREKVKGLIVNTYGFTSDAHLVTHMEMATLFFIRTMDLYLREEGLIGFVMPRAIFSADQHDAFRSGNVRMMYKLLKVIDCENVKPLFYVPTCAIIAKKGSRTEYPVEAMIVSGRLPEDKHKIIALEEARKHLKFKVARLYLNRIRSRSWLDYGEIRLQPRRSYYYGYFSQGASVVPQSCWIVDLIGQQENFMVVETSRRVKVRGKVEHSMPMLPVERRFVYGVLTGAEVMPFCHLPPNLAVLPIIPVGSKYRVITKDEARRSGYTYLANWLDEAEKIWGKVRGEKRKETTLYEWLDYRHKLSNQNPKAEFKVVYLTSGTHLAATVVDVEKIIKENPLLNGVIIDTTLYYYETNISEEAFYLVAMFNSSVLDELIKPMQPRGEYGERHIHKKPLEYPIPKYDPNNEIHKTLFEMGRRASEIARQLLPEILRKHGYDVKLTERGTLMPQEVATVRGELRDELRGLLEQIDSLVLKLLGMTAGKSTGKTLDAFLGKAEN